MTGSRVPSRRIDREALERIIQRAAELQAGELETGEAMTETELLKLGADVGIDGRFLRQAMFEESAGTGPAETGLLARWIGPGQVSAGRVVPGDKAEVERALDLWMADGEALTVKRRMPDRTVWERQKGFFAEVKRGFGVGGKSYDLAKAQDVTVMVTQLEPGFCHVEISAGLTDARTGTAVGGTLGAVAMGSVGLGALALVNGPTPLATAILTAIAGVPIVGAMIALPLATRAYKLKLGRTQLGAEQVLDRLERGEIKSKHKSSGGPKWIGLFGVADEVKKAIEQAVDSQRGRRRLPPSP